MENKRSLFSAIPSAIIAGIIAGMIVYFGLNFGGYKEYQAQAKVITTNIEQVEDQSHSASTYAATINSPKIKQRTLETLQIDWNVGKFDSKLEIRPIPNTAIIDIIVTDTNKLRAEDLADQYADYCVRVINNIYNSGADIMEYSYGSASILDNTLKYAVISGLGFAILWMLVKMLGINSHNKKIEKVYLANTTGPVKEVREVTTKPKKTKTVATPVKEKEVKEVTTYGSDSEDSGQTRVIYKDEIEEARTNKYEVLGRLPHYPEGEIDV